MNISYGRTARFIQVFYFYDTDVHYYVTSATPYGDYNAMIGGLRDDTESNITLITTFPELFAGFRPD